MFVWLSVAAIRDPSDGTKLFFLPETAKCNDSGIGSSVSMLPGCSMQA